MISFEDELHSLIDFWLTSGKSPDDIIDALMDEIEDLKEESENDV